MIAYPSRTSNFAPTLTEGTNITAFVDIEVKLIKFIKINTVYQINYIFFFFFTKKSQTYSKLKITKVQFIIEIKFSCKEMYGDLQYGGQKITQELDFYEN